MQSTIAPELGSNEELLGVVEKADSALRQSIRAPIEGLSWIWTSTDESQAGTKLTVTYEGNSDSRIFTLQELESERDVVWKARDLWENVVLANIRRTSDRIIDILHEFEPETLLQGA